MDEPGKGGETPVPVMPMPHQQDMLDKTDQVLFYRLSRGI
jgi:hypothetical protein